MAVRNTARSQRRKPSAEAGGQNADVASLTGHDPRQNGLLNALPAADYDRIGAHLELVPMKLGDVLYEPGGRMHYVYFPTTSIVSLLYVLEDGASAEIAIVGNDGILGVSLFMGGE